VGSAWKIVKRDDAEQKVSVEIGEGTVAKYISVEVEELKK